MAWVSWPCCYCTRDCLAARIGRIPPGRISWLTPLFAPRTCRRSGWSGRDEPDADKAECWSRRGYQRDGRGIYTYGHPTVDAALLDRLPGVRVISNFGVGVDHIDLAAAAARGIPVGNTPGILDGATADLAFALLLAAGRRLVEGDRYARGPDFLRYDPSYMLGREVHGSTLGIIGMGRIGEQVARRARGFDMTVLYHNRQPPAGGGSGARRALRLPRRTARRRRTTSC